MKLALVRLAAGFSLGLSTIARADPPATPVPGVDAARAEGDAIISAAHAADLFDNVTGADGTAKIRLRHRLSGFACDFTPGSAINNIVVYAGGHPRGDDVGCNTSFDRISRTTNFTRDNQSDAQILATDSFVLKRHYPSAEEIPPAPPKGLATVLPNGAALPPHGVFRLANRAGGTIEEAVFGHARGWLIEERFTAPLTLTLQNGDFLEYSWASTAIEGLRHEPVGPAPVASTADHQPSGPPTPAEIAEASAAADRILRSRKENREFFENATKDRLPAARHRASGVICKFDPSGPGSIAVGFGSTVTRRPDAVTCVGGVAGFANSLTIMRNLDHSDVDQTLKAAITEFTQIGVGLAPAPGAGVSLKTSNLPEHRSARFVFGPADQRIYAYIGAAVVGDWLLISEVHGPSGQPMVADLTGEITLVNAMSDIQRSTASSPGKAASPAP
jgi:hypothetical protein